MSTEGHSPATADRGSSELLLRLCHDLKACLRSIQPHAELLRKSSEASSDHVEKQLGFILDGSHRLDVLVEGLAAYAVALHIDQGSFQLTPMETVLRGVLMKLDKELNGGSVKLSHDKLPRVKGDPDRLNQLFDILIRGCLQRRGAVEPTIHIGAEPHAEGWLFSVRDNGGGIVDANLERIFRPFEGRDVLGRSAPGLGLATCRVIVEQHGGRIWAEPNGKIGAAFLFTLPKAEP